MLLIWVWGPALQVSGAQYVLVTPRTRIHSPALQPGLCRELTMALCVCMMWVAGWLMLHSMSLPYTAQRDIPAPQRIGPPALLGSWPAGLPHAPPCYGHLPASCPACAMTWQLSGVRQRQRSPLGIDPCNCAEGYPCAGMVCADGVCLSLSCSPCCSGWLVVQCMLGGRGLL